MSKRGLRHQILHSSVTKLLPASEEVGEVVVVWSRHRWFLPYAVLSGLVIFGLTAALGVGSLLNQLTLAVCAVAIASMATTNYWVLAEVDDGLVLCRSSRIRQYATALVERLDGATEVTMVGSTVISSDWRVDGVEYTLSKRWEPAMRTLAANRQAAP